MVTKYYSLSYPQSGATWLRYIARNLLNINKPYNEIDKDDAIYTKTHSLPMGGYNTYDKNKHLILVIKDFKECIPAHISTTQPTQKSIIEYVHPLQKFYEWQKPKKIIYYQDLILNTKETIYDFANFLSIDNSITSSFCNNLDYHKAYSRKQHVRACLSQDNLCYYQQKFQLNIKQWNTIIKCVIPSHLLTYLEPFLE